MRSSISGSCSRPIGIPSFCLYRPFYAPEGSPVAGKRQKGTGLHLSLFIWIIQAFSSGSVTINRVERLSLSQRMTPWCSRAMDWAMDNPRPKPSGPDRALSAR